ncbi:DUF4221 domain-containing protein [Belliella sp. DSM 107340]|uniref:DUF4221 domain-containing protein n=1 Tax=Belliella calami TaxID=2923436 RepID=A0ABS9USC1_9BACT|nr:DUF4221 domain-containing protein [Belliella calami]MCH7399324.1 DUF4221 domain-containing protein [Belliella calami]
MKQKFYLISLLFFACSKEHPTKDILNISISEAKQIDLSNAGLSSLWNFTSSKLDDKSFLVLNTFTRSIDTIFVNPNGGHSISGSNIPTEGPNGVESINYFTRNKGDFLFIDHHTVYTKKDGLVNKIKLNNIKPDFFEGMVAICNVNLQNKNFDLLDTKNNFLYFFLKDLTSRKIQPVMLNLSENKLQLLNIQIPKILHDHVLFFNENNYNIENPYTPNILLDEDRLLISYPFSNQLQVYSLKEQQTKNISPKSDFFKSEKEKPNQNFTNTTFIEYTKRSGDWQDDILFGPLMKLEKNIFFRFVRDNIIEGQGQIYLEVFNDNLTKLEEINISLLNPNITMYYIPIGNSIFVKSKNQTNEDLLEYYLLNLN